ncbi:pyruvate dehydrogenase (acetyl-transferring) E1 component subunit alpha [Actinomycetospora endophytica]|uniref:2-oxoisovalerate dehydrogenase subunit alpha n=1 Tax=Actinomycetospora endophytica TaxID=2291215 RepID=A0ABS8P622_9PSEU|nr:thiamine pyrophosphate-dependent enzyme [Actinomycetospora endophytica]MCD2193705.1 pyruvate dehydrogenase (acetyl-transferring) E1 component subunit alpha [Actinomycetospora endophytica]
MVEIFQLLGPDGDLRDGPSASAIDAELCRALFRDMVLARRFDDEAYYLQRQGELGLWLQSRGQEAAQVGSIRALRDTDWVFPSYRDHAAALCRGIEPAELLAQWRGVSQSGWDPARYRFHIYTLVLAAQLPHAVGYAIGAQHDGADELVMTYFGEGSSSEGEANEAFNWAATMAAPVLFFCQNNQWAISTPTQAQFGAPLHQRAAGFGLSTQVVDGNDVLAVHVATSRAAEAVRCGEGPAFIEALTYRIAGHSTSDDPTRYRSDAELDHWQTLDPLDRLRRLLEARGWADDGFFTHLEAEATALAERVRGACRALAAPEAASMFDHVLAEPGPALAAERAAYVEYAGSFLD